MRVKPKTGLIVRDPDTFRPLPVEGADVPESSFWLRRVADGDVIEVEVTTIPDSDETKGEANHVDLV